MSLYKSPTSHYKINPNFFKESVEYSSYEFILVHDYSIILTIFPKETTMLLINSSKILGIVTEYNPFHNGHLHHIQASKELTGSDMVVAVMSGHFTQRGEPALDDPWVRAEWALKSGVDLVIELPTVYATASAAYFAHGAIAILDALNCIDCLCFGSESGDINQLQLLHTQLSKDNATLTQTAQIHANQSYSTHRTEQLLNSGLSKDALSTSNDILGLAYLEALSRIESPIEPFTIHRIISGYHDESLNNTIASATAIRRALLESPENGLSTVAHTLPESTLTSLKGTTQGLIGPNMALWREWCLFHLRHATIESLSQVHDMADGLEHRMKQTALSSENYETFETNLKTKIYTTGRLKRVMAKMLLGIHKHDLLNDCLTQPEYIRVLGFNEKGRSILNQAKPKLPLITNGKHFYPETELAKRQWAIDCQAADLYALLKQDGHRKGGVNFSKPPVYLRKEK